MKQYEHGDIATFYFIINKFGNNNIIKAYTDSKDLAKIYMDFHKCKKFTIKKVTKPIDEITPILEENIHDEIGVYNIIIKDPDKKYGKTKEAIIPATMTEMHYINEEARTYMGSRVSYDNLNMMIPYLKNKYQRALHDILLNDVIAYVVHNKHSNILTDIDFDTLMMLYRSFPDEFGM